MQILPKPRITTHKTFEGDICYSCRASGTHDGWGDTPCNAYRQWIVWIQIGRRKSLSNEPKLYGFGETPSLAIAANVVSP